MRWNTNRHRSGTVDTVRCRITPERANGTRTRPSAAPQIRVLHLPDFSAFLDYGAGSACHSTAQPAVQREYFWVFGANSPNGKRPFGELQSRYWACPLPETERNSFTTAHEFGTGRQWNRLAEGATDLESKSKRGRVQVRQPFRIPCSCARAPMGNCQLLAWANRICALSD